VKGRGYLIFDPRAEDEEPNFSKTEGNFSSTLATGRNQKNKSDQLLNEHLSDFSGFSRGQRSLPNFRVDTDGAEGAGNSPSLNGRISSLVVPDDNDTMGDGIRHDINNLPGSSPTSITNTLFVAPGTAAKPAKVAKPGRTPHVSDAKVLLKLPALLLKFVPATAGEIPCRVEVFLDFEARNVGGCDLTKAGTWRYASDQATEVLVLTYYIGGNYQFWTPAMGWCEPLGSLAADEEAVFVSHGNFEQLIWRRIMVEKFGFAPIPLRRWRDTMAACAYHRLPLELEKALLALKLAIVKDKEGRKLVLSLSKRNKKTGLYPEITPEIAERVAHYNRNDVDALIAIDQALGPLPEQERVIWELDQRSNSAGFRLDLDLVRAMQRLREPAIEEMNNEFSRLVDGQFSPTQRQKLFDWLIEQGVELKNLRKETLEEFLKGDSSPETIRRVLEIRREAVASSLKKLDAMLAGVDEDGRARGTLVYHGAATGRWTGRRLQPQNLPRPLITVPDEDIEPLVAAIKAGDVEAVRSRDKKRGNLTDVLVSCLRYAIIPGVGMQFAVGDFEMIEACIVLALARQQDKCI
jgi:DNA polymerase